MDNSASAPAAQVSKQKKDPLLQQEFDLMIRNRHRVVYQGKAAAVSSKNDDGPLDILSQHTHFISIVKEFVNVTKIDGTIQQFPMDVGVMKVYENQVRIYIGIFALQGK